MEEFLNRIWTALSRAGSALFSRADVEPKKQNQSPFAERIAQGEFIGIQINVVMWNIIIRPVLSIVAGFLFVVILDIIDTFIGSDLIDWRIGVALTFLFAAIFGTSDGEVETVPSAHAAMVTFLGKRLRIYRTEGDYTWTGKKLFLGRYSIDRSESADTEPLGTDKQGFINLGEIQIAIWNRADERNQTQMDLITRDTATIRATLLIVIQLLDPYAWTTSSDPLLDIAERARSAFRTAASYFTAVDNAAIKSVLGNLMSGKTIVTSFLRSVVRSHAPGSVIQDEGGVHMYDILDADATQEDIDAAITVFKEKLIKRADADMLEAVKAKGSDAGYVVEHRSVEDAIEEVIEGVGAKLIRASVGTITLPGEVTDEANKAASEARQRDAQLASAHTFAATKKIMDDAKTPGDEVAAAVAAAKDNPNVRVVFVPGADSLTKAAVAGASQINPTGAK